MNFFQMKNWIMQIKNEISLYDMIGFIADIQTSFTENFKELENKFNWQVTDARLQVFFNCSDLAANSRLSLSLLGYSKKQLFDQEWWGEWACYDISRAFTRIPDFGLYVNDKCRQLTHRTQEQLLVTTQIYIEAFIRNLAKQHSVKEDIFWDLRKSFLIGTLGFTSDELKPLTVYQHLKNTLHNMGLHNNPKYPELEFDIDGCQFLFKQDEGVKIGWEHVRGLIIANSDLLKRIVTHQKVCSLPEFFHKNVVVLRDGD